MYNFYLFSWNAQSPIFCCLGARHLSRLILLSTTPRGQMKCLGLSTLWSYFLPYARYYQIFVLLFILIYLFLILIIIKKKKKGRKL